MMFAKCSKGILNGAIGVRKMVPSFIQLLEIQIGDRYHPLVIETLIELDMPLNKHKYWG